MLLKTSVVTALGLASSVSAVGNAIVRNNCDFEVSLWSVGSSIGPAHVIKPGHNTYVEKLTRDPKSGGRTLKITRERDGLFTNKPQTNYAYSLDGARVWYDLSDVFGSPFKGFRTVVYSSDRNCPAIVWPNGVSPGGSQVKTCGSNNDITLSLCAK